MKNKFPYLICFGCTFVGWLIGDYFGIIFGWSVGFLVGLCFFGYEE